MPIWRAEPLDRLSRCEPDPGPCAQNSCGGFAAKINAAGSALVYSSRFGGSSGTASARHRCGRLGQCLYNGRNRSADFPRVNQILGACRGSCGTGANQDGFVTKINAAGNALVYSSYLGGSGDDNGGSFVCNARIAVDSLHNAYLSGCTLSTDFPQMNQISGACRKLRHRGHYGDAFVTKIAPSSNVGLNPNRLELRFPGDDENDHPNEYRRITFDDRQHRDHRHRSGRFRTVEQLPDQPANARAGRPLHHRGGLQREGTGQRTANLTITDNAPDSPQMVPLTGNASARRPLK